MGRIRRSWIAVREVNVGSHEEPQQDLFGRAHPPAPPEAVPPTGDSDLRTANAWFVAYLRHHKYSDNTVAAYTAAVESLARSLARPLPLRRITGRRLRQYVQWLASQGRRVPPTTLATRITGLRRFFRAITELGALDADPAADLRLPREPRRLPTVLTHDEISRLRQEAHRQFAADADTGSLPLLLLTLMLDLGLRRSEIEALTATSIVPRAQAYEVTIRHPRRSHRHQNRTLSAPPGFAEVYHAYRAHHPPRDEYLIATPRRTLYRVIERLGKAAGLTATLTPSALRWTCALHWYHTQLPPETQRLLGLSPIGWQHAEEVLRRVGGVESGGSSE